MYSESAWFHVFTELARLYIVNFASSRDYLNKIIAKHYNYASTDGAEFQLPKGISGILVKSDVDAFYAKYESVVKSYSSVSDSNDPDQNLIRCLNYFTNFQLSGLIKSEREESVVL